jgi:hypothetical protein
MFQLTTIATVIDTQLPDITRLGIYFKQQVGYFDDGQNMIRILNPVV